MFVAAIVGQVVCFVSPPGWGWIPKPAWEISPGEGEFSRGRVFRGWGVRVCTSGGCALVVAAHLVVRHGVLVGLPIGIGGVDLWVTVCLLGWLLVWFDVITGPAFL